MRGRMRGLQKEGGEMTTKTCCKCGRTLPIEEFIVELEDRFYQRKQCNQCREKGKEEARAKRKVNFWLDDFIYQD